MGTFRHSPDDIIFINTTSMPLSFFLTLQPTYSLPVGSITRYYEQTVTHYTSDGDNAFPQDIPYAIGDDSITNEVAYAAAFAASLAAVSLPQAKLIRINEMLTYSGTIKSGNVIVGGYTFFSDPGNTLFELVNEDLTYTRAAALPVGYYVNDINYVQRTIATLADLEAIIDRIVGLYYLCDLNADVHRAAINALGTVSAVEAYDFTTGWPTIPY
jgi:hypothetical protein